VPSDGEEFALPTQPLRLVFNQPVRAAQAGEAVTLETADGAGVPLQALQAGDSALVLRHAPLRKGTTYRLIARRGLRGTGGPLPSERDDTTTFRVHPEAAFRGLAQSRPYDEPLTTGPFDPERGLTLRFATPVRMGNVRRAVRFAPAVAWPAGVEAGDAAEGTEHTLRLPFAPETAYTLTITDLKDLFGQTLARATMTFRTTALAPSLRVPEGVMVIEAGPQAAIPVRATNVADVRIAAERLTPETVVRRLMAYDRQHYYGEVDEATRPRPRDPRRTAPLGLRRNVPGKAPLRFDTLLAAASADTPGGARTGVVAFALQTPALGGDDALQVRTGIAQFTRLGLTVKHSPHESLALVTEIGTAQPLAGVAVSVRGLDGRVRWRGTTGRDGRAPIPGWSRLGLTSDQQWQKPIQVVFAERGADFAFTTNLYEDGLEPWRFDVDVDWNPQPETYAGVVFTDRGLYRAGETAHVKGWLRRRTSGDWAVARDTVRVLVTDARGRPALDRRLRLSDTGAFDLTMPIATGATQGGYSVRVVRPGDTLAVDNPWDWGRVLASGGFRVESFRAATFSVRADPAAEAFVAGDRYEAVVSGRYLFGAAMGGAPVRYDLFQRPATFQPEGYDGWRFGAFAEEDGYDERIGSLYANLAGEDATLDAEGRLRVAYALAPSTTGVPLELALTATVTDPSRQAQSDETRVMLHPGLFYVGLRPRTSYLDLGRARALELDLVTIDPGGVPVGAEVRVELVREEWTSVREVGADGRLRWVSERREQAKGTQTVRTAPGRLARLQLPVAEGGTYRVRASARDVRGNVVRTETYFYAAGEGYVAWQRTDDDRIELVPDKRTAYAPGETARLMVQSPFETATALVTVEREGVMESRVVTLTGSAPQIEVPLTEAHLPNVFVSVILLTGRAAQPTANADVGAPQFRVGYANLRVDAGARHLRVEVEAASPEVRPGEEIEVNLRLVDRDGRGVAGEMAFSAADAGVVDLIKYTLPDPYDAFYGPRALAVTTSESRAVLVDQRAFGQKEEDRGGGGGEAERLRKDFRPLAYWAPSLRTGRDGRARVRFRVPERLTTLRLMASAATADHRFGNGQGQTIVTQPLVLSPALPRFARQGDTFEAGVLVTNRTSQAGEAVVNAQATGLTLTGAQQRVRLDRGETREVRFRFAAPRAGTARVAFTGTMGQERDGLEVPLRVDVPAVREASASFARIEEGTTLAVAVPEDRVSATLAAGLSSTALAGLGLVTRDLLQYPYGCLEQRTSAVRPFLFGRDVLAAYDAATLAQARPRVTAWLNGLEAFWTGDGFALWPGGAAEPHPYASAYTILALAEARAAGYGVPEGLTRDAVDWLAARVRRASERPFWMSEGAWADTRALMLYALARHGRGLDAEVQALATASLSPEGEALLLRAATAAGQRPALAPVRQSLAQRLRDRLRLDGTAAYLDAGPDALTIFGSDVRATAHGLAALAEAAPASEAPVLAQLVRGLVGQRENVELSTQEGAVLVEALGLYARRFERQSPALTARVRALGRDVVRASFEGRSLRVEAGTLAGLPAGRVPVEVSRTGAGALYLALRLESLVRVGRVPLSAGLGLSRTLELLDARTGAARPVPTDAQGRAVVPAGGLVRVTLRLNTPTERPYVAVDDAIAAGLEVLSAALSTTDQRLLERAEAGQDRYWGSFSHTETRDDRVLLFADRLDAGEHTFTYVARATTPGTYVLPPAHAELMYRSEVQARTAAATLVVR
jgi:alpha-2-macroglobulin